MKKLTKRQYLHLIYTHKTFLFCTKRNQFVNFEKIVHFVFSYLPRIKNGFMRGKYKNAEFAQDLETSFNQLKKCVHLPDFEK